MPRTLSAVTKIKMFNKRVKRLPTGNRNSPLFDQFKYSGNYEKVKFEELFQRQNRSTLKSSLSQLGVKGGVGYICLRHSVILTPQVKKDYTTLLKRSGNKVFRTEDDESQDPSRKQLLTTCNNVFQNLEDVNQNINSHSKKIISKESLEKSSKTLEEMYTFIASQPFFVDSVMEKEDIMMSLLGSFSPSVDQILHWDYIPTVVKTIKEKEQPLFVIGAFEDNTYLWLIPNSHKATFNPTEFKLKKPMLIHMMKGDVIVCNAMILHAGYGYGKITNIRFHMYLWSKQLHLHALYEIQEKSKLSLSEQSTPGNEVTVKFNEDTVIYNELKITSEVKSEDIKQKRVDTLETKRKRKENKTSHLAPGRKAKKIKVNTVAIHIE